MAHYRSQQEVGTQQQNILQLYFKQVRPLPLLNSDEEKHFGTLAKNGDPNGRERMITSNLRLVIKIAYSYNNCGLALVDLIEEGNLGLMHAVEKFNPQLGFRFSTYAVWWIRHYIERALINQARSIRLPVLINSKLRHYLKAERQLFQQLGRNPTADELATALNLPLDELQTLMTLKNDSLSYDQPIDSSGDKTWLETFADPAATKQEDLVQQATLKKLIESWLHQLTAKHRDILIMRFGLLGHTKITLEEVSAKIGLSRERVRQLQLEGLQKLRSLIHQQGLSMDCVLT